MPASWPWSISRSTDIRFALAVNQLDGAFRYSPDEVRPVVALAPHVRVIRCDTQDRRFADAIQIHLFRRMLNTVSGRQRPRLKGAVNDLYS